VFGDRVIVDVEVEIGFFRGSEETDKVGVSIVLEEVYLAGFIDGEDACPDEDEGCFEIAGGGEEEFADVGEYAD
jgi:hypothetical protein